MGPIKKNLKEKPLITLTELDFGNSVESFAKVLDSQKDLLHSQLDHLENIIVKQCRLTGVNPLSQEMAAGALSINIGKKPRDLLNPKGVKYMQAVFSIKDTISKKETREISALCGLTASQVREFFSGQRSRVRKLVRLSREKTIECNTERMLQGGCSTAADHVIEIQNPVPLNSVDPNEINTDAGKASQGGCSDAAMPVINPIPLNSVDPKAVGDAPSCSSKEEMIPGTDDYEKTFIENIFNLMKKEETFSGQVKLMEWILRIENSSVLYWFVTKGGLMMLAAWLNEAALEEQTTTLLVVFQVLCHLPLHKALPVQMSAVLQTVNRLRFYRTSDISNRAKALLAKWSKLFFRNQALKKPSSSTLAAEKGKSFGQSGGLSIEWQSNLDLPEDILSLALDSLEDYRKLEPSPTLKLLQAPDDDSNKKHILNVSSTQTKERRKVQLMDQPGRNTNGRSLQVARGVNSNQARPMSADDIQKAKLRQNFMQSKYGKTVTVFNGNRQQKIEDPSNSSSSQTSHIHSPLKPHVRQIVEDSEKPTILSSETSPTLPEPPLEPKPSLGPKETPWEKLKRVQIPWHLPPEIKIPSEWSVCLGENSKEVEIQSGRIRREKETIYQRIQDIPPNPKEPWDLEMDYDDSLTPQIPIEQAPEEFPIEQAPEEFPATNAYEEFPTTKAPEVFPTTEAPVVAGVTEAAATGFREAPGVGLTETMLPPQNMETVSVACADIPAAPTTINGAVPEPDLELLAVLLQNPDLVFALTSGQAGNLSSADTVRLLDMIKNSGGGLVGVVNGLNRSMEGKPSYPSPPASYSSPTPASFPSPTPTSFPSPTPTPTPTSESLMNGWSSDVGNHAYPQPVSMLNEEYHAIPPSAPVVSSPVRVPANDMVHHQNQTASFTPGLAQFLTQTTNFTPQQQNPEYGVNSSENFHSGLNPHSIPIASAPERQLSETNQNFNRTHYTYNSMQQNILSASYQLPPEPSSFGRVSQQPEMMSYEQMYTGEPAPVSGLYPCERTPLALPQLTPTQQSAHLAENMYLQSMHASTFQWNATSSDLHNQTTDYMDERQRWYDAPSSNPWSQINQNNYNSFPGDPMHASVSDRSAWDRNDPVDESDFEAYSPSRRSLERSRSPEYRSRRNYSERRRDHGRNSRHDWSRRRDYGREDHKQSNRRWRDRRY